MDAEGILIAATCSSGDGGAIAPTENEAASFNATYLACQVATAPARTNNPMTYILSSDTILLIDLAGCAISSLYYWAFAYPSER